MIIGRGMLALAYSHYDKNNEIVIFASGVSNSLEKEGSAFAREIDLVKNTICKNRDKLFVYFSTCSMYDSLAKNSPYTQHKLNVEKIISESANKYLILRVSQILGHSKNSTLVNFLFEHIDKEKQFDVWKHSNRNMVSLEDVVNISQKLIQEEMNYNQIFHIANKFYIDVPNLVALIEKILDKKAKCQFVNKGQKYQTIPNDIESIIQNLDIFFGEEYYFRNLSIYHHTYVDSRKK